jgi:hypothetical protein
MEDKRNIILWICFVLTMVLVVWCVSLQIKVANQAKDIDDHKESFNFIMEYNKRQTDEIIDIRSDVNTLFRNDKILEDRIDVLHDIY